MARCPEHGCNGRLKHRKCLVCGFCAYRPRKLETSGYGSHGCGDPWKGKVPEHERVTEVDLGEVLQAG